MNLDNTVIQMRKGILEYCILLVISRGEIYASDLIEELKDAQIIVVEGTLYPLLNRLHKANILEYTWKESSSGPPRKYYRLAKTGTNFLGKMDATWNGLSKSVASILSKNKIKTETPKPERKKMTVKKTSILNVEIDKEAEQPVQKEESKTSKKTKDNE